MRTKRKSDDKRRQEIKNIMHRKRERESNEQTRIRQEKDRSLKRQIRELENVEETTKRLKTVKELMNALRKVETHETTKQRLQNMKRSMISLRGKETPEKTKQRLQKVTRSMTTLREEETPEQNKQRLQKKKRSMIISREEETPEKIKQRLQKLKRSMTTLREEESCENKKRRLKKDKEYHYRVRNEESHEQKLQQGRVCTENLRQTKYTPPKQNLIDKFQKKIKDAADYICCCCHRLMYRVTVVQLQEKKYTKVKKDLLKEVLSYRLKSLGDKEWMCRTCHLTLKQGKMPCQAKANNLSLDPQPIELQELNCLELRLICQRIPFMKMVGLPRGSQHGIHGPAVNVPAKLDFVCEQFPRLPSEIQLIPLKLKRKLKYKSHYMYEHVRPEKVLTALHWLKMNNPHYAEIRINEKWVDDSLHNDPELWKAMTNDPVIEEDRDDPYCEEIDNNSTGKTAATQSMQAIESMWNESQRNHMNIVDVASDGNCLFACMCHHYNRLVLGLRKMTPSIMRKQIADFMKENSERYKNFVCGNVEAQYMYNADTVQPTIADAIIADAQDKDTQKELRWIRYLDGLEFGNQWGEHIVVQAISDYLLLDICIHCAQTGVTVQLKCNVDSADTVHLGLIEQYHYVAFVPCQKCVIATDNTDENIQNMLTDEEDNDFEETSKVQGLPYESSMIRENPVLANKIISVAPGESEKPLPLLSDPHFEELSNPDKYPYGSNALSTERPVEISVRRYFNQRLLDADGRFGKSIEYLLSAQYATESKQVQSDINHFVFRRVSGQTFQGQRLTAGTVNNAEKMNALIKGDHAYKILKNVRGSPGYFQALFHDVLAMVRQLGIPTWFFTVSAADMQWPDLIQTIARQYGTQLSDQDVKDLSFKERSKWLRSNPVTAARHFEYRLQLLFKDIVKSKAHPLGVLVDYVIRIEFQARGSPHAHMVLWITDAPKLGVQSDEEVCDFIDKHTTCCLPDDDPVLRKLVEKVQTHKHSPYCRKKGPCRFNYPRPPSSKTLVAKDHNNDDDAETIRTKSKDILVKVQITLSEEDSPDDIALAALLEKAQVGDEEYHDALSVSNKGINIVLERNPAERCVNTYNPTILKAWQANIDLQYIVDAYACVMYIAAYMTKSESGMGELLKQTCKEHSDKDIKKMLRRVGSVFLNHREVSAQEAAYRILSIPMKKMSREVLFVTTDTKAERHAVLKPKSELEKKDNDEEDIFQKNIIIRYIARPDSLENICLAEFAANYTVSYNKKDEEVCDNIPSLINESDERALPEHNRNALPKYIKLKDDMGRMQKRRREAVIRFRKFSSQNNISNFYRAKLMLYLPWRCEERDLLCGFQDYQSHYETLSVVIVETELRYTQNMDLVDDAIHDNAVNGPPQHMWADIASETECLNQQDKEEGVEVHRYIEQEDLNDNAAMLEMPACGNTSELGARYQAEADRERLEPSDYREMVRNLNKKQRQVVFYHRKWCKDSVVLMRQNKQVMPYRLFLSGPGGVGKSHVIKLIHSDTRKLLPLSNIVRPTDVTVLLTAPTGVAAFNISGMTVHSALLLRVSKYGKGGEPLTCDKLNTLRSKLENLALVIIDEVSMVGSDLLLDIHKRLGEIKGVFGESIFFGNVCILAVGDLYQLPAVCQTQIYEDVRNDPIANLSGSLWKDNFQLHELDEVMRQKEDQPFADLLCRVRMGECTEADMKALRSREIKADDPNYPSDFLHVFAYNYCVDEWNEKKLEEIAPLPEDQIAISAIDDKKDSTGLVNLQQMRNSRKRSETAGLHTVLVLAVGVRVMLLYNVDTSDGLVNGVIGIVEGIIKNNSGIVEIVMVKFDNNIVGRKAIASSQWKEQYPNSVPVTRHEGKFEKASKKGAQISRRQFPLTLAWAVTIHKCQGLTMDKIVVSMKGARRFGNGQAYVAFSRVKTLKGLYITDFDPAGIKSNVRISSVMCEMRDNMLQPIDCLKLLNKEHPEWITVGHLNIRHFRENMRDLKSGVEAEIYSHTDVMCFTETYLRQEDNIDEFLQNHDYVAFRKDISSELDHAERHGVLICATTKLTPKDLSLIAVEGLESKVVVLDTEGSRLIVAVIYRKPSYPLKHFLQLLDQLLNSMPLNVPSIIVGDFNDNLARNCVSDLTNMMTRYGFKQCVSTPTTDSGSLLDHIYFNRCGELNEMYVDVHDVYYSDHDSVFLTTKWN